MTPRLRAAGAIALALVLAAVAIVLPMIRHQLIRDLVTFDAPVVAAPPASHGAGAGLAAVPRVRVVLIDGLSASAAHELPAWSAACARGARLEVDVGFPTVSLPVEAALWSGLTQQQTGIVYRSDRPIVPPLTTTVAARVPGSIAVAEDHPYIVRSLGFSQVLTPDKLDKTEAAAWAAQFPAAALAAVAGPAKLVFVHILRVDTAGHHSGGASAAYREAARTADALAAQLFAADPDARWFLLSDHGHLPGGGHGGEELAVRRVEACIVGPGIAPVHGGPLPIIDLARAMADSLGVTLDPASRALPLGDALAPPIAEPTLPAIPLPTRLVAIALVVVGFVLTVWTSPRWWLAPWWLAIAIAALFVMRGNPTLSTPMIYPPTGRVMYLTWLPAVALAALVSWLGARRCGILRVAVAQLTLPVCVTAAVLTLAGAWPGVLGDDVAAAVPRYTAWTSPLLLMTAHGAAAVALAALAIAVRPASDRPSLPAPPHSAPPAG